MNTTEGRILPVKANAIAAFRHAPEWGGVLAFNEFGFGTVVLKPTGNLPLQGETHGFEKTKSRGILRDRAALAGLAAGGVRLAKCQAQGTPSKRIDELIAYGERSRFVTSIRMPVAERHSSDEFGLTFYVLPPLQDSVGIITQSSLHYTATHRATRARFSS